MIKIGTKIEITVLIITDSRIMVIIEITIRLKTVIITILKMDMEEILIEIILKIIIVIETLIAIITLAEEMDLLKIMEDKITLEIMDLTEMEVLAIGLNVHLMRKKLTRK